MQFLHPSHRAAEKGCSLTGISYTCSSTAKFVVWLQKQTVESGREVTTEQPAVDHIPPASGLTCSKRQRNRWKLPSTRCKDTVLRGVHCPRRNRIEMRKKRMSETGLHVDFVSVCVSARLPYPSGMHKKTDLASMCVLKNTVQLSLV